MGRAATTVPPVGGVEHDDMSVAEPQSAVPTRQISLAPLRALVVAYASLVATVFLFLSERWRWFPFNEHKGWTVLFAMAAALVFPSSAVGNMRLGSGWHCRWGSSSRLPIHLVRRGSYESNKA